MKNLLITLLGTFAFTVAAATNPQNGIFILADDLGWSDTTFNKANAFYETPNIERLAWCDSK